MERIRPHVKVGSSHDAAVPRGKSRVPGAAQHEVVRCRPGTVAVRGGPGSAVHRSALHRVRDTRKGSHPLVDQLPHLLRRQRQRARLDVERGERGGNRIGDDAADRNDAALARAFGAERIVGRGLFLEHFIYDENGQLLTGSFADYLMPTASDFPRIRAIALEDKPSPLNPMGAKGAGEGGIIPVGGVVANAVAAALGAFGVQPRELPLSPPRLWQMIQAARATRASR